MLAKAQQVIGLEIRKKDFPGALGSDTVLLSRNHEEGSQGTFMIFTNFLPKCTDPWEGSNLKSATILNCSFQPQRNRTWGRMDEERIERSHRQSHGKVALGTIHFCQDQHCYPYEALLKIYTYEYFLILANMLQALSLGMDLELSTWNGLGWGQIQNLFTCCWSNVNIRGRISQKQTHS